MEYLSRLIFEGNSIQIGEWRCYPDSNLWDEENIAGHKPMVVFPRSAVQIQQAGRDPIVTSPNQVVFYNKDQTYRRGLASQAGDICEYVYLEPGLVAEIQSSIGLGQGDDVYRPFSYSQGPCHTKAFVVLRSICKLIGSRKYDPLQVEEAFLEILPKLILDSEKSAWSAKPVKAKTVRKQRLQVETVKEFLNKNYSRSVSLTDVAQSCESSPFHMSRIFKKQTGTSIFQYLIKLRLRNAFEQIIDSKIPLTRISAETGFSSPSHMSNLFHREFGFAPSELRSRKPMDLVRRTCGDFKKK